MSTQPAPVATDIAVPAPAVTAATGHPWGLYALFGTEMWERFSYYGMRALLVLYLVQHLMWQPSEASGVYKWYTSLVYLTPLLGGYLADRYLGLRAAIIIGGVLMAIGHFLMAFEPLPFLYAALAFLIAGNGFFKPNISTLVGKLYSPDDPRRDGAFTIFYMGINAGAFLSPLVCGYLAQRWGYHYGFGAAGVGMMIGLGIFLAFQKRVASDVAAAGNVLKAAPGKAQAKQTTEPDPAESEPGTGGISGVIQRILPPVLFTIAVVVPAYFIYQVAVHGASITKVIMPIAFGGVALWMAITLRTIKGAARDKSTVIFVLFAFVVLFWMAFEQAGNALNLWAEFNTDLRIGTFAYPAAWFQSLNPLLIVALAPLFSIMWIALERRGKGISTPMKMAVAMIFMTLSFVAMVVGAASEASTVTKVPLSSLPSGISVDEHGVPSFQVADPKDPAQASTQKIFDGRLTFDPQSQTLSVKGVLPPFAVTQALSATVPPEYRAALEEIEGATKFASEAKPVQVKLPPVPEGFQFPALEHDGKRLAQFDPQTGSATFTGSANARDKMRLIGAGAPAEWRAALDQLSTQSEAARVGGFWLMLSYLLATLGELCLSPVGLAMVTRLAPPRYASLFMGVWLLSSSVAQYVGGDLGESWGILTPTSYFTIFVWTSIIGAVLLMVLVRPLKRLMHKAA